MSSGVSKTRTGSVNGTAAIIKVTLDFQPRVVRLLNVGGLASAEWVEDMADDSMVKTITAGTMTLETSDGITPTASGFDIGADADVNAAGELIHWVAHE